MLQSSSCLIAVIIVDDISTSLLSWYIRGDVVVGVIIRSVVVESVVTWGAMVDGVMVVVGPVLGGDGIRIFEL